LAGLPADEEAFARASELQHLMDYYQGEWDVIVAGKNAEIAQESAPYDNEAGCELAAQNSVNKAVNDVVYSQQLASGVYWDDSHKHDYPSPRQQ
jgi:hypothetical protein